MRHQKSFAKHEIPSSQKSHNQNYPHCNYHTAMYKLTLLFIELSESITANLHT